MPTQWQNTALSAPETSSGPPEANPPQAIEGPTPSFQAGWKSVLELEGHQPWPLSDTSKAESAPYGLPERQARANLGSGSTPQARAMTTLPVTGIEIVDRELERLAAREPFNSVEAAETKAAQLLAIWRALQPCSDGLDVNEHSRSRHQAHRR